MAGGTNLFTQINSTLWVALSEGESNVGTDQLALLAKCTGTPPTTAGLFAHGCIMIQTDSASEAQWSNTGTSALPVWGLIVTDGTSGVDYGSVAVKTNGTTDVNVFAATMPFAATLTSAAVIGAAAAGGTSITLGGGLSTAATIVTMITGTNGAMFGSSIANVAIAKGDVLTVRSGSTSSDATVILTFLA